MIRVWINGQQRDGIDEGWIVRTIQGLRRDGEDVCVRVNVKAGSLDLAVRLGHARLVEAVESRQPASAGSSTCGTHAACKVRRISRPGS